jgi:hypothetical protein
VVQPRRELEKLLRAGFNEKPTERRTPYWQLIFELCILQGKSRRFEELGLEYAVAFEMSAPDWEVVRNSVAARGKRSRGAKAAAAATRPRTASAEGRVVSSRAPTRSPSSTPTRRAARGDVDMGKVCAWISLHAALLRVVKAIQLAGKRVILANLNELNAALLEALACNRYAILVRRKSS